MVPNFGKVNLYQPPALPLTAKSNTLLWCLFQKCSLAVADANYVLLVSYASVTPASSWAAFHSSHEWLQRNWNNFFFDDFTATNTLVDCRVTPSTHCKHYSCVCFWTLFVLEDCFRGVWVGVVRFWLKSAHIVEIKKIKEVSQFHKKMQH